MQTDVKLVPVLADAFTQEVQLGKYIADLD